MLCRDIILIFHSPVSQFALSDKCFYLGDPFGFPEVSEEWISRVETESFWKSLPVHAHVEKLISNPRRFYLNGSLHE